MTDGKLLDEVEQVMQSAIARTRSHFESEYGVSVTEVASGAGDLDSLTLLEIGRAHV